MTPDSGVLRRWLEIDRYLAVYKIAYITGLVSNIAIISAYERGAAPIDLAIGVVALALNLAAWILYLRGHRTGFFAERVLSLGRMIVPAAAATVYFSEPVMTLSPLSVVLWMGILRLWITRGTKALWLICAVLLGLEIAYFRRLRSAVR